MFVVNRSIILQSFVIFTVFAYLDGTKSYCAESTLSLTSNSQYLTDAFNWAKPEALSNVRTGQGNNIPCYQAAIKNPSKPSDNRDVFCIRDWAHHVDGAALLGLNLENYSMLKAFAKEQTAARKWYTAWELNYDGSISDIDYVNDQEFWRILCSMFELVEKGYRMYQWTGDARLYTDADLALFYKRIMVDFLAAHDENNNGIGEEHSNVGWEGAASYNEKDDRVLIETGDVMGCQYQAALAYARFLSLQNDTIGAK